MNEVELVEALAKRAAYMRSWTAKNRLSVRASAKARLEKLKQDPEKYKKYRVGANISNSKYLESDYERVMARKRYLKKANYSPEKVAAERQRMKFHYSTQVSIKSAKKRAIEKNLPFDLTHEWYEAEFEKGCAVTGLPLEKNGSKSPSTAHVDRIIPANGYLISNCRLVCACYNLSKKHWADSDVLRMARALVARNPE